MFAVASMWICGCRRRTRGRGGRCCWGLAGFSLWFGHFFGIGAPTTNFFYRGVALFPGPNFFLGERLVTLKRGRVGQGGRGWRSRRRVDLGHCRQRNERKHRERPGNWRNLGHGKSSHGKQDGRHKAAGGSMADVPKHPLPAVHKNGGPGWIYARGGLSGTGVGSVWISTKGSASSASGAGAKATSWFSPTRATQLQQAAQMLQVWPVSGDAPGAGSAACAWPWAASLVWLCGVAWSWGSLAIAAC